MYESHRLNPPAGVLIAGFETTSKSKPKLIQNLALCLEKEQMRFLPDPIGRHEMAAFEATVTESGYTKYSAPDGQHDDTVIARALAWKAARVWIPIPDPDHIVEDRKLPEGLRMTSAASGQVQDDYWNMARDWKLRRIRHDEALKNASVFDPFSGWTPGSGDRHDDDPFGGE